LSFICISISLARLVSCQMQLEWCELELHELIINHFPLTTCN
jgi:hypothetical protein